MDTATKHPRRRLTLRILVATVAGLASAVALLVVFGWPASLHAVETSQLGVARSTRDLEAVLDQPGPISVETVVGADWEIDRSGLINLKHPTARAAGLVDGPEPIQVFMHALRHPQHGLYLIDTGVERAMARDPDHAAIRGFIASASHIDRMHIRTDTATWLAKQSQPLAAVLLTHLHLDHIAGMQDVPRNVPIYAGAGETHVHSAFNILTQSTTVRALFRHGAIREWAFKPDPSGVFHAVLDVFGDGSLWAISVPGHTPGSTAYLARTPKGPVLFTGDACHTAWGWQHHVEPGTFSDDLHASAASFAKLRALVARHPNIDVRLGHQALPHVAHAM